MIFLEVSGLSKAVHSLSILQSINFIQNNQEKIAIVGESGSGKTTLLQILAGLISRSEGRIYIENMLMPSAERLLLLGYKNVAYVQQNVALRNNYLVKEYLSLSNHLSFEKSAALYTACNIDALLERTTQSLSGGEKQRVAIANVLAQNPRLLLLDEPFSNLDFLHTKEILILLQDLSKTLGIQLIIASHNTQEILGWADKILVLEKGKIVQFDSAKNVYNYPKTEYVAGLFGPYNILKPELISALAKSSFIGASTTQVLVRPNKIKIEKADQINIEDIVRSIQFFGSYYEIEVAVNNHLIKVHTYQNELCIGDRVFLKVHPQDICFIQ